MPIEASVVELEHCIDDVILKIQQHPDALNQATRLRIEADLMRLLLAVLPPQSGEASKPLF